MLAIFKREFRSYMQTMIGPAFIAVMVAFVGIFFYLLNMIAGYPYFSISLISSLVVTVVAVPLLTMRSFSEDRRSKTDQILLTSPLKISDIVLGKFLAILAVFMIPVAFFCVCPLIISALGTTYFVLDYCTILCYVLVGCLFISIGMFISSLTESPIIAAVATIGVLMVLYLWNSLAGYLPTAPMATLIILIALALGVAAVVYFTTHNLYVGGGVGIVAVAALIITYAVKPVLFQGLLPKFLGDFSVVALLNTFFYSYLFDVVGLIELLLFTGLFLFLTIQSVEKRRWS